MFQLVFFSSISALDMKAFHFVSLSLFAAKTTALSSCQKHQTSLSEKPTTSFWLKDATKIALSSTVFPKEVKIVVVGTGLSGSSIAYHLTKLGYSICIVDAREICGGATGRNGGFMMPLAWNQLPQMLTSRGILESIALIRFELAGRVAVRNFCKDYSVDCSLDSDLDAFQLYTSVDELRSKLSIWWYLRHTILPLFGIVSLDSRTDVQKYIPRLKDDSPICCGVLNRQSTDTFSPAKFTHALLKEAEKSGAQVFEHTKVNKWEKVMCGKEQKVLVHTSRGVIECENFVIATNAYTADLLPSMASKIIPVRNHVLNTTPTELLSNTGKRVGVSCNDGFVYFMQRPDKRIVLGGFRNREKSFGVNVSDDQNLCSTTSEAASSFLEKNFNGFNDVRVENLWAGIIGWSCDNRPW